MLHVCPLSKLEDTLVSAGPSHVLSLVSPGTEVNLPVDPKPAHHLVLEFNDIAEERAGLLAPKPEHVERLLDFARPVARTGSLLVHCWAGVSRSTAAAYIIMCAALPEVGERKLAQHLRSVSPVASPNPLLVSLADTLLQRNGRMVQSIKDIGRGADTFEGNRFSLDPTALVELT
ncbi:protein-tyrosine-phosphatase [Pseudovibrio japonicus]|uniref:Protein-tyrosine-phosphatase n=1 Tax=Pseudovibrio japonicus TaxID=366534 RepID=A0ABQ3E084_9HYPH|nr:tyrosine phosphatase family protein [Pseudovibrio japonicus]GHB21478.1 protein-tyrosine-phosphatase [Pseudovibrio japonicus]